MARCAHLLIIDDHTFIADLFAAYVKSRGKAIRVSKATSVPQALAIAEATEDLDIVLLDLDLPGMDGLTGLPALRERRPDLPIAILSGDLSAATVHAAFKAGAHGFVTKTMSGDEVIAAIRLMLSGERYVPAALAGEMAKEAPGLTPREYEVLAGLVHGRSNKEIARVLGVSGATVALHLTNIYRKLDVTSRSQAIRRAFETGLHQDRRRGF